MPPCLLFKDTISDSIYFSISIILLLDYLSSAWIFFGIGSLFRVWISSASRKSFARCKESVTESSVIINKESIKYLSFLLVGFASLLSRLMLTVWQLVDNWLATSAYSVQYNLEETWELKGNKIQYVSGGTFLRVLLNCYFNNTQDD